MATTYIGTGDCAGGVDPDENIQNSFSFLGKLLRIDVELGDRAGNSGPNQFSSCLLIQVIPGNNDMSSHHPIQSQMAASVYQMYEQWDCAILGA